MNSTKHYFGAGPAALPQQVKQQVQADIVEYQDARVSILELSHRSDHFKNILDQANRLLRSLYAVPNNYKIIFMAGGATLQFDAVPLNIAGNCRFASYLDTGFWSRKAQSLANKHIETKTVIGLVNDSHEIGCLPASEWQIDNHSAYLHVTPNETITGVEFVGVGDVSIPVVADLTSCLLMQNIDINEFALLYAATQKSLGISGLSVVIVRDDLLDRVSASTPDLMRYDLHVEHDSIVNTTPVFACYIALLMLQWVQYQGGVSAMVKQAKQRSQLLYDAIDSNPKLVNKVSKANRSTINVAFTSEQKQVIDKILSTASQQGLLGLQGHRYAGGVRASMYNGTPLQAVELLAEIIRLA